MRNIHHRPLVLASLAAGTLLTLVACWGSSVKLARYYVLSVQPGERVDTAAPLPALVRVANLDVESAYDKFQMVVRRSPFELSYRDMDVWAVKPNTMMSDMIARALLETGLFTDVVRELGERRPDFTMGGTLQALELYDSGDLWFAHLAFKLHLTDMNRGNTVWTFSFDERKPVAQRTFENGVRSMSELYGEALAQAMRSLGRWKRGEPSEPPSVLPHAAPTEPQPILVPERGR